MVYITDEDKNEKGATTDSVQQRRQYRRQNQESSSGNKTSYTRPVRRHIKNTLNQVGPSPPVLIISWTCRILPLSQTFFPPIVQ